MSMSIYQILSVIHSDGKISLSQSNNSSILSKLKKYWAVICLVFTLLLCCGIVIGVVVLTRCDKCNDDYKCPDMKCPDIKMASENMTGTCKENPCRNNGTCVNILNKDFYCFCRTRNYYGRLCEKGNCNMLI